MPIPNALTPHLERHLAVFRPVSGGETNSDCLWMSRRGRPNGAHIRAASAALGHVDEKTTTKHYNSAGMIGGVRFLQNAALRHGLAV